MRPIKFIILSLILGSLIFSGCLKEYSDIYITNVDVMSVQQNDGIELTITPYIQNNQNTDSSVLSVKVRIRDTSTNLIAAEKQMDIGYIKSKSQIYESMSLLVHNPGEYDVEVQLFEDGKSLSQYTSPVTVRATSGPGQPADIKLTDMTIEIIQFVDRMSNVVVDVSPGIYNQGGDSEPLTLQVTARVDQYKAYNENDELGIVQGSNSVRGNVRFVLPKNSEYTFSASVIENGKTLAIGDVSEKIIIKEMKLNTPVTHKLVEKGKPPSATQEPGFQGMITLISILLVFTFINRTRNER
jgi:hypothetical protein